jgi:hypothetical protein
METCSDPHPGCSRVRGGAGRSACVEQRTELLPNHLPIGGLAHHAIQCSGYPFTTAYLNKMYVLCLAHQLGNSLRNAALDAGASSDQIIKNRRTLKGQLTYLQPSISSAFTFIQPSRLSVQYLTCHPHIPLTMKDRPHINHPNNATHLSFV